MHLHLHVRTCYFDQIKAGTKTEEYRLHNAHWIRTLVEMPSGAKREFDGITIYNAYKPGPENRLQFPWRGWTRKPLQHPHFGPEEVTVFAIKLEAPPAPSPHGNCCYCGVRLEREGIPYIDGPACDVCDSRNV